MEKKYRIYVYLWLISLILFVNGCKTVEEPKYLPVKDYDIRLTQAKQARTTWMRLLQNAKTVDDAIKAREHLDKIQEEIEAIEAGKKIKQDVDDGFESTKKRTIVFGPLGIVLIAAKWIVDKSFILYPWNWRAF